MGKARLRLVMGHGVGTRMRTLLALLPLLGRTEEKMVTAVV